MKQLSLLQPPPLCFGGSLLAPDNDFYRSIYSKRRQRPLSTKHPLHLVLKAQKNFNLYKNKQIIQQIIRKQAKAFGIKIYGFSVEKDHIHCNIRIFSRDMYKRFIRAVTGLIARKLRAKKSTAIKLKTNPPEMNNSNSQAQSIKRHNKGQITCKVWKLRPFTRIVKWGRAFRILKKYILQNELEIQGLIPKQKRKHKYKTTPDQSNSGSGDKEARPSGGLILLERVSSI